MKEERAHRTYDYIIHELEYKVIMVRLLDTRVRLIFDRTAVVLLLKNLLYESRL